MGVRFYFEAINNKLILRVIRPQERLILKRRALKVLVVMTLLLGVMQFGEFSILVAHRISVI